MAKDLTNPLPSWPGASKVYSKAYKALDVMARRGHVELRGRGKRKRAYPSQTMQDLIEALDTGDEERIKGLLMLYKDYGYY